MARFFSSPGFQAGTSLASLLLRTAIRLDEPTVIKYLLMSRGDPEQAVRLRPFLLASSPYPILLPLVWLPDELNPISWGPPWVLPAVLPLFAVIGGRFSLLRQRLRTSNEELRSALGSVRQMATHDHLTGLPNRVLFNEELQRALARAERHSRPMALFFMDVDRFKNINDTLGHQFGDRVLQEAAKRLITCVREGDIVARLGGDEFVLLVEEIGDAAVLTEIARKLLAALSELGKIARAWKEAGLPRMPIAVNLSASQFREEQLVSQLAEILKSTGTDAGILELEITESMVMRDPDEAVKLMHNLRAMGVSLTIDDFGTGYPSLGSLKFFPTKNLRVDRTFVRALPHSSDDVAITGAVIAMAHSLQMNVIAEGVELREQFDVLREEGCDEFQGYLCRPPLAEEDLIDFIREGEARAAAR